MRPTGPVEAPCSSPTGRCAGGRHGHLAFVDDGVSISPCAVARDGEPKEEDKKQEAFELVLATVEALLAERGAEDRIWGSMVKQTLKRRRPGFNESYYGFRSFNKLLEEAAERRLITLERDAKSGGYLINSPP